MSLDLLNALTTGATVVGGLRAAQAIESFFARRNGNGNGNKFSQSDHDTLRDVKNGVDLLHEDLTELRADLRDCLRAHS